MRSWSDRYSFITQLCVNMALTMSWFSAPHSQSCQAILFITGPIRLDLAMRTVPVCFQHLNTSYDHRFGASLRLRPCSNCEYLSSEMSLCFPICRLLMGSTWEISEVRTGFCWNPFSCFICCTVRHPTQETTLSSSLLESRAAFKDTQAFSSVIDAHELYFLCPYVVIMLLRL